MVIKSLELLDGNCLYQGNCQGLLNHVPSIPDNPPGIRGVSLEAMQARPLEEGAPFEEIKGRTFLGNICGRRASRKPCRQIFPMARTQSALDHPPRVIRILTLYCELDITLDIGKLPEL